MKGKQFSWLYFLTVFVLSFLWQRIIFLAGCDQSDPKIYRLRVRGRLSPRWSDWFDGFQMAYCDGDTILTNPAADQAALHGALAKIRDLGLPILLVENLEHEEDNGDLS
ncbi:hypothetical protein ACFLXI_06765 [Chloroflexota bacterium]